MTLEDLLDGFTIYMRDDEYKQLLGRLDVSASLAAEYEYIGSFFIVPPVDCYYCERKKKKPSDGILVRKLPDDR